MALESLQSEVSWHLEQFLRTIHLEQQHILGTIFVNEVLKEIKTVPFGI